MAATATVKVIDASALAALVFDEPAGERVTERIREREALVAAYRMQGLDVQTVGVDHQAVVQLALQTGLTACDASYLWLARDLAVELVTLDRRLASLAETAR